MVDSKERGNGIKREPKIIHYKPATRDYNNAAENKNISSYGCDSGYLRRHGKSFFYPFP